MEAGARKLPPGTAGSKTAPAKLALIKVLGSYCQMVQLEGKTAKPRELTAKAIAAVKGTQHESMLESQPQRSKLLKRVRQPGAKPLDLDALPERRVRPTWGARPLG